MKLSKETYQSLEDIVGPDNISNDPAILESYAVPMDQTSSHLGPFYKVRTPRAQAVVLPGCTEEVQAIVKVCNKHGLKCKASSTFWATMGHVSVDYAIQVDLRRMDRVLEIEDAVGNITSFSYAFDEEDPTQYTTTVTDALGQTTYYSYSPGSDPSPLPGELRTQIIKIRFPDGSEFMEENCEGCGQPDPVGWRQRLKVEGGLRCHKGAEGHTGGHRRCQG